MAQTVLKNSDNKLLRNIDGKLLKQNYNIGNGFKPASGYGITTKLRNLVLNQYTIESCSGIVRFQISDAVNSIYTNSSRPSQITAPVTANGAIDKYPETGSKKWLTYKLATNFRDSEIYVNGTILTDYAGTTYRTTTSIIPSGTITLLRSGVYLSGTNAAYEYRLFSRILAAAEIAYNANNGSFNEPFSALALEVWYKYENAEILDFSDALDNSDLRVGIRDYSGNNRHGEITTLPAGTIAEKLAFANANLFQAY